MSGRAIVWDVICDVVGHGRYDHLPLPAPTPEVPCPSPLPQRRIGQVARDPTGAWVWRGLSDTTTPPDRCRWRGPVDTREDAVAALHTWIALDQAVSRWQVIPVPRTTARPVTGSPPARDARCRTRHR